MAAPTADPAFHFPALPDSLAKPERLVVPDLHALFPDKPLGAFRGLAFAIVFKFLVGFIGYVGWVLLRHLR
jgi:hypothetical protein